MEDGWAFMVGLWYSPRNGVWCFLGGSLRSVVGVSVIMQGMLKRRVRSERFKEASSSRVPVMEVKVFWGLDRTCFSSSLRVVNREALSVIVRE